MGAEDSKVSSTSISKVKFFPSANSISLSNRIIINLSYKEPTEDYTILSLLGETPFSSIYHVQNKYTGLPRLMEKIKKQLTHTFVSDNTVISAINNLRTLDHPNLPKIFDFYSGSDSYSFITEMISCGNLLQELTTRGPFNEKYASYVMFQIFSAVKYCHSMNIKHRDLKMENILITKRDKTGFPSIKVSDFGITEMFDKGKTKRKIIGNPHYMAPEVIKNNYDNKCDMWSCGIILYIMLSGRAPFDGESDSDTLKKVMLGKYNITSPPFDNCSKEVKDLISNLLIIEPYKRLSAEEVLNHSWFKNNKSQELFNNITDTSIIKTFIENLKTYKCESVIQETAYAYLVHNFSEREDIVNACKFFNQINVSGNGKITKGEFLNALKGKGNSSSVEKEINIIFKNIDSDNNGYIELEEFIRAAIRKESFIEENILRIAFRYFDKDNSGEISFDEMEEVFKDSSLNTSSFQQNLKKIISEVDLNGDGLISFEEFTIIMKKLLTKSK